MEESPDKTPLDTNASQPPALWKRFWMLGLLPVGALSFYLGVTFLWQATDHPRDDGMHATASVAMVTGFVTMTVASLYFLMRLLPSVWRNRHRFRFSLRTLFIVVTILAVGLGWVLYEAKRQEELLAKINAGESMVYSSPKKPAWLPDRFDVLRLRRVDMVYLDRTTLVADLSVLSEFKNLRVLQVDDRRVSDISALVGLQHLQRLNVSNADVRHLSPLAGLQELEHLNLSYTKISDLAALTELPAIKTLNISGTQIRDLSPLAGLQNLEQLYLSHTQVDDVSVLAGLQNLTHLDLSNTQVSDIAPLAGLPYLQELDFSGTQVSDVSPLAGLSKLEWLNVSKTRVSEEQVQQLKKSIPDLITFAE